METWKEVGEMLRVWRAKMDKSQEECGAVVGVSQQTWCAWEGGRKISAKYWDEIADKTGVDVKSVVRGASTGVISSRGDHNLFAVRDMTVNKVTERLSPEEMTLINMIRKKSPDGQLIMELIAQVVAK